MSRLPPIRTYIAYHHIVPVGGRFTLTVTADPTGRQTVEMLREGDPTRAVEPGTVPFVDHIRADIEAPGSFRVTPLRPELERRLTRDRPQAWSWDVEGMMPSDRPQRIVVRLSAYTYDENGRRRPAIEVGDPLVARVRVVPAEVSVTQWIGQWVSDLDPLWKFGTLVATTMAALVTWFRTRSKPRRRRKTGARKPAAKPAAG